MENRIRKIEIKDIGIFDVKHDYTHRERSRLVLFEKGNLKEVQFDSLDRMLKDEIYQKGIDLNKNEIQIRIIK